MSDDPRSEEIEQLEALMAGASRAFAFPALAEAQRRAGHPEVAERVARQGLERAPHTTAGRVALALALLDQKRTDEAAAELERLLGGETEHAIAHEAVANEAPEGLDTTDLADGAPVPPAESLPTAGFDAQAAGLDGNAASALVGAPIVGELATIDPYPDSLDSVRGSGFGSDAALGAGPEDPWAQASDDSDPIAPISQDSDDANLDDAAPQGSDDVDIVAAASQNSEETDAAASILQEPAEGGPFGPPPPPAPAEPLVFDADDVRDEELDSAFAEAESDTDQMLGADDVAQAALASVPEEEDGDAELDPVASAHMAEGEDDFRDAVTASATSPFATETVVGLLEQQGHAGEADLLRGQMAQTSDASESFSEASALELATPGPRAEPIDLGAPASSEDPLAGIAEGDSETGFAAAPEGAHEAGSPSLEIDAAPTVEEGASAAPIHDENPIAGNPAGGKKQATLERWLDNLRRDKR